MKSSPRPDSPDGFHPGILEYMLEGCQILDHEWRYLYLNPTAQVHSRREPGELLGQRFQDMFGTLMLFIHKHLSGIIVCAL